MEYFTLNNGLKMPVLGFGTSQIPENEVEEALNSALEAGFRHIDCSPIYKNEQGIGRCLKSWIDSGKIKRESLFITNKLPTQGNRASCVEKYLRNSLKAMELDYFDLYLIHFPFGIPEFEGEKYLKDENGFALMDTKTDHLEIWKVLEEMVNKGLIKSIGLSNFNKQQIQRVVDNSTIRPSCLQIELHLYFQQTDLVDFCESNDIKVVAFSPLGSRGRKFEHFKNKELIDDPVLSGISKKHNKSPAQVLLRWITQRGIGAVPKSSNLERLKENFDIFNFKLTNEEMELLKSLDIGFRFFYFGHLKGIEGHPEYPFRE
ncbi:hypothetical protein ACFFRR_006196 [Megaselia abdita]